MSRSRPCKVSVSSRGKNQTSHFRLGLVELPEGLGLGLVSDQKLNVSVSSRSRKLRSRLHPCQVASASIQPFSHNRHGPIIGWGLCLFLGGAGSPSSTKSPGLRPTSVISGILIHPAN